MKGPRLLPSCLWQCCGWEEAGPRSSDDEEAAVPLDDATLPSPHHRPPSHDSEHYVQALARYARSPPCYGVAAVTGGRDRKFRQLPGGRDKPLPTREAPAEMGSRQFASLPELLRCLSEDLAVAYISFVKELVREPHDGAWLLLDLLRSVQHEQTALHNSPSSREQQAGLRRALLDEHACLCCLRYALRCADTATKLAEYQQGLYSLAVAVMSNLTKSRTVALQLLTRVCESSPEGHRQVLAALTALRLRCAESVRCRFLVTRLQSHPTPSFAVWALRLLNSLVMSAESLRQRIHLQEELREAGFDSEAVLKTAERVGVEGAAYGAVQAELQRWRDSYVDVSDLGQQLDGLSTANRTLSQELANLREANMKLLEENVLLKAVGGEVHEQFIALQRRLETHGLPSAPSPCPSVSDSDISSIGPVRRGTVIRKPSRTTTASSRSHQADSKSRSEQLRATTPDVLARQSSPAGHVSSDTFTYASGHKVLKDMHPEPLPRTTSLNQAKECRSQSQAEEFPHNINANSCEDLSLMAPCYVSPIDFRSADTSDDATINRYTPPVPSEGQGVASAKGKSRPNAHQQRAKGCVPSLKRKAPKAPSPSDRIANSSNNNNSDSNKSNSDNSSSTLSSSPLSSSTSSLSSASSNASGKMHPSDAIEGTSRIGDHNPTYQNSEPSLASNSSIERQTPADPEYQNVRRRNGGDECQGSEDGDYQQDTAVYEAITLGPDTIEMVSRASSSGCSSQESSAHRSGKRSGDTSTGDSEKLQKSKQGQRKGGSNENNSKRTCDATEVSRVHESVKHYENIATNGHDGINAGVEKKYTRNKLYVNSADFIENDTRNEDIHLNSADSSLSINSQNTVKEKKTLENIEDRASPDGRTSDELEIVPSRQPQMDPKRRSKASRESSTCDPILLFEFDSPTETSDTETWPEHCPPSPRTIETASTRSFGFVAAPRGLKRRDTITEYGNECGESVSGRRIGLKRSESFQAGDSVIGESIRSRAIRRRGSTDHLPPDVDIGGQQELHINGRTFVKYSPQDVLLNNEMNDLLTAALNRRQCRSVEDRLDQWLEEDLRRYQPEAALILKSKVRGNKKKDIENFANADEPRFGLRTEKNNNKNKSSSQHHNQVGKSKSHAKRFSSCDLIAFNGFINPSPALVESDYGPNFMLNRPSSKRKTEFLGDKAEFGLHEFPPTNGIAHWTAGESRWGGLGVDPAIPTPDYGVTPAGTLTPAAAGLARHILDIPSGLY